MKIEAKQEVIYYFNLLDLSVEDMRLLEVVLEDYHNAHNGEFSPQHSIAMKAKVLYRIIGNELRERNM
jgi:hypothetical protein